MKTAAAILASLSLFSCLAAARAEEPMTLTDSTVLGPPSLTAKVGNVLIRIDGPKLWTLSRIEYKGTLLGIEESAYGTVFGIKDVGWIGSAHKEHEVEQVTRLRFLLDGKELNSFDATTARGTSFRMERESRIRSFAIRSTVEVKKDRLYQSTWFNTDADVDMKMIYLAMYAWTPTATAYLFGSDDGTTRAGTFKGVAGERPDYIIENSMIWLATYDGPSGKGTVTRVMEKPSIGYAGLQIADAPGTYRKLYVMSFAEQTVPASVDVSCHVVTGFFEADEAGWKAKALELAETLKNNP